MIAVVALVLSACSSSFTAPQILLVPGQCSDCHAKLPPPIQVLALPPSAPSGK